MRKSRLPSVPLGSRLSSLFKTCSEGRVYYCNPSVAWVLVLYMLVSGVQQKCRAGDVQPARNRKKDSRVQV